MFEFKSVGKDIKLWAKVRAYLIFIPSLLIAIVCWLIGAFGGGSRSISHTYSGRSSYRSAWVHCR